MGHEFSMQPSATCAISQSTISVAPHPLAVVLISFSIAPRVRRAAQLAGELRLNCRIYFQQYCMFCISCRLGPWNLKFVVSPIRRLASRDIPMQPSRAAQIPARGNEDAGTDRSTHKCSIPAENEINRKIRWQKKFMDHLAHRDCEESNARNVQAL